jgi:hypothetical protein
MAKKVALKIHWGEHSTRMENKDANIYTFATPAERSAFMEGVLAGEGWEGWEICCKGCGTCSELAEEKAAAE